jgi:hypothetical protein
MVAQCLQLTLKGKQLFALLAVQRREFAVGLLSGVALFLCRAEDVVELYRV